ncbi:alpha/beta fold hydrolase [Streptomyces sp. NPDC056161]|uniref:alpha/beta fold hydrolase n=1 Tax=Streptomyces sp. NPDC056161 TaxID=3345732 RepID=UPI0035D8D7C8
MADRRRTAGRTTVVLVHGGWHDETCWDPLREELDARGIPSTAVRLPMTRLDADADVVRTAIEAQDGDVIVVAHSWGGSPATLGASGLPRVKHLVYLAAFMIEAGVPVTPPARRRPTAGGAAKAGADGTVAIDASLARQAFYDDVSDGLADRMIATLRPMAAASFEPVATDRAAAWRTVPSTYAVCLRDRAIHPEDQRAMAGDAGEVVEFDTGHSPFLSRPDLVADLIADRYDRLRRGNAAPAS